jgi:hypothetical protein
MSKEIDYSEDLWPSDLDLKPVVSPAIILRTQAALLGKKTQGLVQGAVETRVSPQFASPPMAYHIFYLVVPPLGNYRYALFKVHHSITAYYPVLIDEEPQELQAEPELVGPVRSKEIREGLQSEESLREWLRRTLSSEATKKIISSLYWQVAG